MLVCINMCVFIKEKLFSIGRGDWNTETRKKFQEQGLTPNTSTKFAEEHSHSSV